MSAGIGGLVVKIIYLHQYFNTPNMSGGTRSYEIARRLVNAGHEVHMITSQRHSNDQCQDANKWFVTYEAGIIVHWTKIPYSNKLNYYERIRAFILFAWRSAARAAKLGGDVIFATSTPLTIAIPAVYAARKNKIPMIFEVRDLWPELPIAVGALRGYIPVTAARWLERFAYRNALRVVALSPGMKDGVVATGYPEDKIAVIPNSCDLELFNVDQEVGQALRKKYDWLQDRPLVVYTGTIGLINGVDYLARLASIVYQIDSEIRFAVIGTGKDENKVRQVAKQLGILNRNFYMLPSAPKREIPHWLSAADVATSVVIDLKEMWSNSANKFFDALAAGKPIVINYGGWQADIIRETGAGLVLDANNLETAAHELVNFIRNKEALNRAGKEAKNLAYKRFDRDKLVLQIENLFREVIEEWQQKKYRR